MPDSPSVEAQLRQKLMELRFGVTTTTPKPILAPVPRPPNKTSGCGPCQAKMLAATKAASGSPMRLSVIAAAANEGNWVRSTFANVEADMPEAERIVCDDASTDGCCDALGDATVLRSNVRRGAGMSRSIAMAAATGNVLASIDPHEEYSPGLFQGMAQFVLENQCIACPSVASMEDRAAQGCGAHLKYVDEHGFPVIKYNSVPQDKSPRLTEAVVGAAYFMPRTIYNRLPSWPSIIDIWGYEEETLAIWAYMQGIKTYALPEHTVYHYYRDGKVVPWGGPTTEGILLNAQAALFMLFERGTYDEHFAKNESRIITPALKNKLALLKAGTAYDTGQWKIGKIRSDEQTLTELLQMTAPANPKVSVIVPTYNRDELLQHGLKSLRSQSLDAEIIVVDDGGSHPSTTRKHCETYGARYIRLESPDRRVPSVPINAGVRAATGDIIVLTCPEIYHLQPDTLSLLVEPLYINDTIHTTCKGWDDSGAVLTAVRNGETVSAQIYKNMGVLQTDFPFFLALHKKHFEAIGGYDEGYLGWGFEDYDFITRIQAHGLHKKVTGAEIIHLSHERFNDAELLKLNTDRFNAMKGTIVRNQK